MVNTPPRKGPKLIKRYANRKLYDTDRSCYVTLEEIADMVKDGDDLRIIDNRTGEDLTSITLTQIIYEGQKKPDQKGVLPLIALRQIIQSGGEIFSRLTEPVARIGDDRRKRQSRYDGPYGDDERTQGLGEPHQPRYTFRDPNDELTIRDLFDLMVSMDQRMNRMERQIQRLSHQIRALEQRRPGPGKPKPR